MGRYGADLTFLRPFFTFRAIAPLEVLPAIFNISLDIPVIAVNITVESDLVGSFNFCTGVCALWP